MLRKLLIAALCLVMSSAADAAKQGERCGGFVGIRCDAGLWCQMPTGQCHVADGAGSCAKAPEICDERYLPVCGCDNKTYSNDCHRQAAKVSKAQDGKCS